MSDHCVSTKNDLIVIQSQDLPLACPRSNQPLWNAHPRVYLPIEKKGIATCPYCGQTYQLI